MSQTSPSLFRVVSDYVEHMLPIDNTMKVLLVDEATLNIISMSCSHTSLLKRGVFLVTRVSDRRQRKTMKNMRCIAFISPEQSSVEALADELRAGKYESYSINFSSAVGPELLVQLARADIDNLVTRVEEVFCDFDTINNDAFISSVPTSALLPAFLGAETVRRIAEGIASTFIALRRKPHIRFQQSSTYARRLASDLDEILSRNVELYSFKAKDAVLLIMDRDLDPLTPLVTPWTYQAMLHEHIGLNHNRLRLPTATKDDDEYVFSQQDDDFFAANMFANWGDICNNIKMYLDKCKETLNIDRSTATLEEIKQFMQKLPQTKSLTGSVTKHATVISHISTIIKQRDLLDISLLEQDMISSSNPNDHWNRLQAFASKRNSVGGIDTRDLFRLCLIYHLRYDKPGQTPRVAPILESLGPFYSSSLRKLQQYHGERPTEHLFAATGVMASIVKTFVDVGNIYTQHEPALKRTLLQLFTGRLSTDEFPYLTPPPQATAGTPSQLFQPKEVTVFMCGGFTYAEAALINAINAGTAFQGSAASSLPPGGLQAAIGGTSVINSEMFLTSLSSHP